MSQINHEEVVFHHYIQQEGESNEEAIEYLYLYHNIILASNWSFLVMLTECFPLIGQDSSHDLNTGLSFVNSGHVTYTLFPDWSIPVT